MHKFVGVLDKYVLMKQIQKNLVLKILATPAV